MYYSNVLHSWKQYLRFGESACNAKFCICNLLKDRSVTEIIQRRIAERQCTMNWRGQRRKQSLPKLRFCHGICPQKLQKNFLCQGIRRNGRDMNRAPPEQKSEPVLSIVTKHPVQSFETAIQERKSKKNEFKKIIHKREGTVTNGE